MSGRRFKRYPAYKDSGVEWLGEIPAHWEVNRTKFAAQLRSGHTPSRQHPEYWQDCTIPWFGLADVWQIRDGRIEYVYKTAEKISELGLANSAARLLPKATVILSRTASVGFSAILGVDMATTQDFVNWVCGTTLRAEYLLYVFRSMGHEFRRLTMGSTHQTIYMPDAGAFSTPIPPVPEQDQIVAAIRRETTRIDALVAKKERLVELLHEERTAVITRAVTKGLDPNVPMKDSGVEWLGEIPAHWEAKRLRLLLTDRPRNGLSPAIGAEGSTPTFSTAAVNDGVVMIHGNVKYTSITLREAKPFLVLEGDVLLLRGSGSRTLVGRAGIVIGRPPEGCIYPDILIRLRPGASLTPWFLVNWLNSTAGRPQIEIAAKTAAGIWKITGEDVRGLVLPVPPYPEQLQIETDVARTAGKFDATIERVRHAIERLQELRTALISAAVTGKIDVREEAA